MTEENVLSVAVTGEIATVTLTRPKVRNALNEHSIVLLTDAFHKLSVAEAVRVVLLKGDGPVFCAGGDLSWLKGIAKEGPEDRQRHAMQFAQLFDAIDRCAKPVIAVVHGPVSGAGLGLVAAADIAIAVDTAVFTLPEAKRGLSSAILAPYLLTSMGRRALQRYMTTGESFTAATALRLGLIHEVCAADALETTEQTIVAALLKGAPHTISNCLEALRLVEHTEHSPDLMRWAVRRFAETLGAAEAQEGIAAFDEKREPRWSR